MSIQNKFTVGDVMLNTNDFPVVDQSAIFKETLEKMDSIGGLGIACVVDSSKRLLGVITDGDIRRKLLSVQKPLSAFFIDDSINHSIKQPITTSSNMSLIDAVNLMEDKKVWDLPVVDNGKLVGLLHLHSAIKILIED
jgi:DeoR family transcriptional regulator, catabolite repression regulator